MSSAVSKSLFFSLSNVSYPSKWIILSEWAVVLQVLNYVSELVFQTVDRDHQDFSTYSNRGH